MTAMKHARFIAATVLAALLRCIGGFCGGRGGVTGGQSVQYAAAVFSGYGLFKKDFELFLGQRYAVGDKAFKKPHAAAKAFRPVFSFLCFLLLHKLSAPVFKLSDFFLNARDFLGFGLCHV